MGSRMTPNVSSVTAPRRNIPSLPNTTGEVTCSPLYSNITSPTFRSIVCPFASVNFMLLVETIPIFLSMFSSTTEYKAPLSTRNFRENVFFLLVGLMSFIVMNVKAIALSLYHTIG